jgi:hypothetical protein
MVANVPTVPVVKAVGAAEGRQNGGWRMEDGKWRMEKSKLRSRMRNEKCKTRFCDVTSEICDSERSEEMP